MIFGGQAGGWPGRLNEIFGAEMVGLEFAPIEVEVADDPSSWRAEVPGRVRAAANALSGPTSEGKPPRIENLPRLRNRTGAGRYTGQATADQVEAFVFNWEHDGKSSKHITFDWSGPDAS